MIGGSDTIADFHSGNSLFSLPEQDILQLEVEAASAAEEALSCSLQKVSHVIIVFGDGEELLLQNIHCVQLQAMSF